MWIFVIFGIFFLETSVPASACGPWKFVRQRSLKKLSPLVFKEHVPNMSEFAIIASGQPEGKLTRKDAKFKNLVPNYSKNIIFKDEEGTGSDRLMTKRLQEKLDILAVSVMNMFPGVKLRVTEAWDEDGLHPANSLHNEGRAVDITTSDRDRSKYGMLGRLAIEAGFDFVYYESRSHIHCSVKPDSADVPKSGGCFHGNSNVQTPSGEKKMSQLEIGDKVLVATPEGNLDYSEVILFLDHDDKKNAWYITITTESGAQITLTSSHLIFTKSEERKANINELAIFAKNIEIGHYIYVVKQTKITKDSQISMEKVVNITVTKGVGTFAPLTKQGNLVVNNVVVSSYAVISHHELAHFAFLPVRILYNFKQALWHFLQKLYVVKFATPQVSAYQYQPHGIHWYAAFLYKIAHQILPRGFLY